MIRNYHVILASSSPRRQCLLREAGYEFEIRTKEIDELFPSDLPLHEVPSFLAKIKAEPFLNQLKQNEVLITCDTVVIHQQKILGKPTNEKEAIDMLLSYSNTFHTVVSGLCISSVQKQIICSESTHVYFDEINFDTASYYVQNYKPYDKAGAYAIQEWIGFNFINRIEGCFYNVMGLPLSRLKKESALFF